MCVTLPQLALVAQQIAKDLDIGDLFSGGRAWFKAFMTRHPELSVRTPEKLEHARAWAVSPLTLKEYFARVKPLIIERTPEQIWNMDEVGCDLMNIKDPKVRLQSAHGFQCCPRNPPSSQQLPPLIPFRPRRSSRQRARGTSPFGTSATAGTSRSSSSSTPLGAHCCPSSS